jgi:glucose/arabinose dehydrogenase
MIRRRRILLGGAAAFAGSALRVLPAIAANGEKNGDAAARNFAVEHEIGHRFQIDPNALLPAPKTPPIVTNRSMTIPFGEQTISVPKGFTAAPFAVGLANPRRLLVLPNGDVLVAEQSKGYLTLLREGGDGRARWIDRHVEDLNKPYGLAWRGNNELLVVDQDAIWRVPHVVGALRDGQPTPTQKAADVPAEQRKPVSGAYGAQLLTQKGVFGIVQGHQNRWIAIEPNTGALFVGVGSSGNLGIEPEPKATIQRFAADGSNQMTFASGTRNATALTFHPTTGDLWAVVQERDGLGDNLPSDYLIRVQQGGFYGWPYAYIGKHPQPGFAEIAPAKVAATITPDLLFQAHSSLLDLVFYEGDQFPAEYRGSLFVALKGSWNRSLPTGYKIARVPFKDGRPEGYYENFATGFWASGEHRAEVFGRPAALAVAKDGALLVADDTNGTIWRIAYSGK